MGGLLLENLLVALGWQLEEIAVNPVDVGVGLIERRERLHVFGGDVLDRPGGHEVEQVRLVHTLGGGAVLDQAALLLQPRPHGGVGQGLQHAHHRVGNTGAGHELHDPVAGSSLFAVEADDEAGHHPQPAGRDLLHRLLQGAASVLQLAGRFQAGSIRSFDPQEHALEAAFGHQVHQLLIGGQIHRGLGGEAEGVAVLDLPLAQGWEQQLHVALVADEVVVHQEHRAAPAQVVEPLQLGDQLLGGLGARLAPVEHDDVAELAVERAASGELHRHLRVGVEFQQVVARHRSGGHVRFLAPRCEAATGLAPLQGLHEQGQGDFSFVEHLEIGLVQLRSIGRGTGEGTAHRH